MNMCPKTLFSHHCPFRADSWRVCRTQRPSRTRIFAPALKGEAGWTTREPGSPRHTSGSLMPKVIRSADYARACARAHTVRLYPCVCASGLALPAAVSHHRVKKWRFESESQQEGKLERKAHCVNSEMRPACSGRNRKKSEDPRACSIRARPRKSATNKPAASCPQCYFGAASRSMWAPWVGVRPAGTPA